MYAKNDECEDVKLSKFVGKEDAIIRILKDLQIT